MLDIQPGTVYAVYNTSAGGSNTLASASTTIDVGIYRSVDPPTNLFDGSLTSRFSSSGNSASGSNSYAGLDTGFYVTLAQCNPVLIGFRFAYSYQNPERDPLTVTIEGTDCSDVELCTSWMLLYNGSTGLDTGSEVANYGDYQAITNSDIYKSYRFLVTSKRNRSNYVTYNEVQLFGYSNQTSANVNTSSSRIVHEFCEMNDHVLCYRFRGPIDHSIRIN